MNGLDEWITGHYGEDQFLDEAFCMDCIHWDVRSEKEGGYCNKHSKFTDAEEWCDDIELCEYYGETL